MLSAFIGGRQNIVSHAIPLSTTHTTSILCLIRILYSTITIKILLFHGSCDVHLKCNLYILQHTWICPNTHSIYT